MLERDKERAIDLMVEGFKEVLLFTADEEIALYGDTCDYDKDSHVVITNRVLRFIKDSDLFNLNLICYNQIGNDLCYTANGHGVGFWDRPEVYGKDLSKKFALICLQYNSLYTYVNDQGLLSVE